MIYIDFFFFFFFETAYVDDGSGKTKQNWQFMHTVYSLFSIAIPTSDFVCSIKSD